MVVLNLRGQQGNRGGRRLLDAGGALDRTEIDVAVAAVVTAKRQLLSGLNASAPSRRLLAVRPKVKRLASARVDAL
jgi:hypothetical protein